MGLLIASRQSDLARLQAYQVGDELQKLGEDVRYHFRESLGDINQEDPLWEMPEKGVFTQDFRQGLELGEWDMVVHSWKDLPIDPLPETELVATLPRADARDVFLCKKSNYESVKKNKTLKVFSSSPRRMYNLSPFLKKSFPNGLNQVEFSSVRGNILTRVKKMIEDPNVDGLIVAKAALDRLLSVKRQEFLSGQKELASLLQKCLFQVLPLSMNPTAAAQGALAIEIKKNRPDLKKILAKLHCQVTWDQASKEREILKKYGGGCHQKIGVTQVDGEFGRVTYLRGETEQGEVLAAVDSKPGVPALENPCRETLSFFRRETIDFQKPQECDAHYVARHSAIPDGVSFSEDEILWTSGTQTWFELAKRGYWVNGCSDSLGEDNDIVNSFFGQKKWAKWTHDKTLDDLSDKKIVATYTLKPEPFDKDLSEFKEFYWMSGTQFQQALKLFPGILHARHFCGSGHTYTMISDVLRQQGVKSSPNALASRELWLKAIKE